MAHYRIAIIDGSPDLPTACEIQLVLQCRSGYELDVIPSGADLSQILQGVPDLYILILPVRKPEAEKLIRAARAMNSTTPVLCVLDAKGLDRATEDLLDMVEGFITAPVRDAELGIRVQQILSARLSPDIPLINNVGKAFALTQIIGDDPASVSLKEQISIVAQFDATVLLIGETGTGKEMCARALHYSSDRAGRPFLPVNCGAIPVDLFESELYGHERGAFTGALAAQSGLIAEAEGGTLFLDEVESLSLQSQVKLLRFLQDRTYFALGSAKPRHANVRIIAATNADLLHKAQEGSFRDDLYYRLAVITLTIAPLRNRKADIPLLVDHFMDLYGKKHGERTRILSAAALRAFCRYEWPGNVRELENAVQQVIVLTTSMLVEPDDLPLVMRSDARPRAESFKESKARAVEQFEKNYVTELLIAHHGNVTHAAMQAKKERRAFGRLVKKYHPFRN